MGACPQTSTCVFFSAIEPSLVKRIKFASAFPYCRGGRHEECAIRSYVVAGDDAPEGLLPDGMRGDYLGSDDSAGNQRAVSSSTRFLVVDDSPVFATIAANAMRQQYPEAEVVCCHSFDDAEPTLRDSSYSLVVSGNGLGGGRTVHDVRRLTFAPIVLFTGRAPAESEMPANSRVVAKGAGPEALRLAVESLLGR